MKPLDLERFFELESNRLNVANVEFFDLANADRYRQIAIDAIAELKALRAWRQTINKAVEEGLYDEKKVDMYNVILDAWNAAETELHDANV